MMRWNEVSWPKLLAVFLASFSVLLSIFVVAVLRHQQAMDYPYLWFALPRITAIAIATSVLGLLANKWPLIINVFFGALVGYGLAAMYINF